MQTSSQLLRRGVVIGRFMPPHAGHLYLVDFARSYCDRLTVLVCTLPDEPISGELRFRWMRQLFPDTDVVHITESIPEARKDAPGSTAIWARTIREHMPEGVDYVFASETYGEELAEELGAGFVAVDPSRTLFPVSATDIRNDPMQHWRFIPPPVRPYYLRRVCILSDSAVDPGRPHERLAQDLAHQNATVYVGDYGRFWLSRGGGSLSAAAVEGIVRAQAASESAVALQAQRLLFAESSTLQITARARLVGTSLPAPAQALVDRYLKEERYHLYLMTAPRDEQGESYLETCRDLLSRKGVEPVRLPADRSAAFERARDAVRSLLS